MGFSINAKHLTKTTDEIDGIILDQRHTATTGERLLTRVVEFEIPLFVSIVE